jgi:putative endonuclease
MPTYSIKKELGDWGEKVALEFLITQGYQFVTANYRCYYGEIDLICKDGPVWCFIEVKTRKNLSYGEGYYGVTPAKLKHLMKTAIMYLSQHHLGDVPARFDIVSIDFITGSEYKISLLKNISAK